MAVSENEKTKKVFNTEGSVMTIEPIFSSRNKSPPSAEIAIESDIPNGVTEDVARLVYSDVNLTILDQIETPKMGGSSLSISANNDNEPCRVPSYYLTADYKNPANDYGVTQIYWSMPNSSKDVKETVINIKSGLELNKKNSTSQSFQQKLCTNIVKIVPDNFELNDNNVKTESLQNSDSYSSLDESKNSVKTVHTVSTGVGTDTVYIKQEHDNSNNVSPDRASCSSVTDKDDKSVVAASMKQSLEQKLKKIIAEPSKDKLCGFQSASHLISSLSVKLSKKLSKNNTPSAFKVRKNRRNSDSFRFLRQTSSGRIVKRTRLASINIDRDSLLATRKKIPLKTVSKSNSKLKSLLSSKAKPHQKKIKLTYKRNIPKSSLPSVFKNNSNIGDNSIASHPVNDTEIKNNVAIADESFICDNEKPSTSSGRKRSSECINVYSSSPKRPKNLQTDSPKSDMSPSSDRLNSIKNEDIIISVKTEFNMSSNAQDTENGNNINSSKVYDNSCKTDSLAISETASVSSSNEYSNSSVLPKNETVENIENTNNKMLRKKNKHSRFKSEVRRLIEESIKATKTIGTSRGKIRKSKCRILPNKRRTECDRLLDMLSEIRSPYTITRLKNRKLFGGKKISPCMKNTIVKETNSETSTLQQNLKISKFNKQETGNKENNQNLKISKTSSKVNAKKIISCTAKTKQKLSSINSESKTLLPSESLLHIPTQIQKTKRLPKKVPSNAAQKKKAIKMKLQLEKKKNNKAKVVGNSLQPRNTVQMIEKPISLKTVISPCANETKLKSNILLRVPIISLSPTTILQQDINNSTCAKSSAKEKNKLVALNKGIAKKDNSKRSSVRQAESSYKFKDIILKFQKNFVQIIIMSNTKVKNGLNPRVLKELRTALISCKKDSNCRLILLSSTGSIFCSGVDLHFLIKENKIQRLKAATEMSKAVKDFTSLLISYPKPIVVAVNGAAIGLGMTLLTLCDIIYANDKATFYAPYASLGQVPEGCASIMLPKCMDLAMVGDLFLGNRRLTAEEACQRGLVSKVFWPSKFFEEVIPRVEKMASQNLQTMEATKALLRQHMKPELDAALERECQMLLTQWCTTECQKAMKNFLEQEEII